MKGSLLKSLPTMKTFGFKPVEAQEFTNSSQQKISGIYTDDYNILTIHQQIVAKFRAEAQKIGSLKQKLNLELLKLQQPQTIVERKNTRRQIEALQTQIEKVSSGSEYKQYLEKSKEYLQFYSELGQQHKVISFKESQSQETEETKNKQQLRNMVICRYLDIARQYIEIDLVQETPEQDGCPGCGTQDEPICDEAINGPSYCPNCGLERIVMVHNTSSSSSSNISNNPKSNYADRDNFYKTIRRYQGKQPDRIPAELYTALDRYFTNYGLPSSEEVRKLPLDAYGLREGTSREMLFKALADIGRSAYYEDVNLIGHNYWGWKLHDISHLEDKLMEDYDASQRVFVRLKSERKSCLNAQYRLFKHLQRYAHEEGFPCREDDFKIVTTRETLEYHDEMWQQICQELGWKFIKTI